MAREAIADDVELVWRGPAAGAVRSVSYGTLRQATSATAALYLLAALASAPLALGWVEVAGIDTTGLLAVGIVSALTAASLVATVRLLSRRQMELWGPAIAVSLNGSAVLVTVAFVVFAGPRLNLVAVYFVNPLVFAFFFFRVRFALGMAAWAMAGAAAALLMVDGTAAPVQQWLLLGVASVPYAILVGKVGRQADEARQAERAAKEELADLNRTLEERVESQVSEIERVGRLRRFLAPQVADVVMSDDLGSLLEPHRAEVGVLFCDLRGFTRFSNTVDPDTIVSVLGEYYAAVGAVLEEHKATIGGFDGDGIMAYLGDPIELDDVVGATTAMAREIGDRLDELTGRWRAAGHELGYGIGIAHGPATLGVVGFDGRYDYTPLGAVVNLAARLCSDAQHGEIVVDGSMRAGGDGAGLSHRGDVTLKGFTGPVATYALGRGS